MQKKKKSNILFKMATIVAILDFGPSPKYNGMILGPYLIPPPSHERVIYQPRVDKTHITD